MAEWLASFGRVLRRRRVVRAVGAYALLAWGLIQVSNEFSQAWGVPPSALGRIVFLAALLGLPLVLYVAWAWSPRPGDPPSAAAPDPTGGGRVSRPGGRVLALGVSAAGLLTLLVVGSAVLLQRQARAAELRNLAVLPFHTEDPALSGIGIADEITTALAAMPGLKVVSGTSTRDLAGPGRQTRSARRVAASLGVGGLVEGNVRVEAGRVRILARLVDARRDRAIWSGSYAESMAELPAAWLRVAEEIAGELGVGPESPSDARGGVGETGPGSEGSEAAGPDPAAGASGRAGPRVDTAGYRHFLKGREHFLRMTAEDAETAIHFFREALARDSTFVPARAGLAQAYLVRSVFMGDGGEAAGLAEAEAAVRGDSSSAEAWTALGWARRLLGRDGAAEAYRRALALRPSDARAASGLGALALGEGDWAAAVRWLSRAAALDPRNALYPAQLGHVFWRLGRLEEAGSAYREAALLAPGQPMVHAGTAAVAVLGGDTAAARESVRRLLALDRSPASLTVAGDVAVAIGDIDSARARYRRAIRDAGGAPESVGTEGGRGVGAPRGGDPAGGVGGLHHPWTKLSWVHLESGDPSAADEAFLRARAQLEARTRRLGTSLFDLYERAELWALRGQRDSAVRWLVEARRRGWRDIHDAEADPLLASLRGHPGFERLAADLHAELDSVWDAAREGLLVDWAGETR